MIHNLEKYIKTIKRLRITQRQLLFLLLLKEKRYDLFIEYKEVFPLFEGAIPEDTGMLDVNEKADLIAKGLLVKFGKNNTLEDYRIGENFNKLYVDKYEAGNELWSIYPTSYKNKGVTYPLTLMDKNLFRDLYYQRIHGSLEEHIEILKDLEYAIENDLISYKIETFVTSEQWNNIRKERVKEEKPVIKKTKKY